MSNTQANKTAKTPGPGNPLAETVVRLLDEIDILRANQIPGRCGECGHWDEDYYQQEELGECCWHDLPWPRHGFCHEWKPKENP